MIATTIFVLFSISLSTAMPTSRSDTEETFSHLFFPSTGQFLRFMEDGTVTANGQFGDPQSQIKIHFLANEQVRLQYMMEAKDCFLVYENGKFHGSTPRKGNEIFQREDIGGGVVALRLVNYIIEEESSSGSGAGVEQPSNSTNSTSEEPTEQDDSPTATTDAPTATTEAPTATTDAPTATTEAPTATTEATTEASEQPTSTQEPRATVCYLGFPDAESAPRCYDSKENPATQLIII